MVNKKFYVLTELPYAYNALEPFISEAQLRLHHDKHHAAYVNGANAILKRLDKARQAGTDVDIKAILKELSFQAGGHILHHLFWQNLVPATQAAKEPGGALAEAPEEGVRILRALQEGIFLGCSQCRGLGLGGTRQVWLDRQAADHADREA